MGRATPARIDRLRWWRYRIPFRTPFATAHGVLAQREGVLLELTNAAGIRGLGEIAPLPGFGGSLDEVWPQLPAAVEFLVDQWVGDDWRGLAADTDRCWPAALRCGVETALLDIAAQVAGCSIATLLGVPARESVPLNATVGVAGMAAAASAAARAVEAGFATIKLKVGIVETSSAEVERIAAVRQAIGPATRLRLDANEAWTAEMAIGIIRRCEAYRLEWVEQPVAASDLLGLAKVRRAIGTPIAADESVTSPDAVCALLEAGATDVLILKPMVLGGPAATLRMVDLASAAGVDTVVTSTLETGVGLAAAAHAAAALPAPGRACGLATATLLEDDLLVEPLRIEQGSLLLPEGAGLGVHVDWERLRRYTVASGELVI